MAGKGCMPSEVRSRPRDTARRQAEMVELVDDGEVRGFPLPVGVLPDDEVWHSQTVAWWETWRRAPQSQRMVATDWQSLLETALLHHVLWSKGKWEYASEVRLRAAKFGATVEDRLRLRLTVHPPDGVEAPAPDGDASSVTSIRSRRSRLSG